MKKLKRDVMNVISGFEIGVALPNDRAMNAKHFKEYKKKYNAELEKATNKILTLVWNAFGELI